MTICLEIAKKVTLYSYQIAITIIDNFRETATIFCLLNSLTKTCYLSNLIYQKIFGLESKVISITI